MDVTTVAAPAAEPSVQCPMCGYDLRGQVDPRCPECGYRFDWEELRDPARRLHPYLFEHHPERNLWSFCRTFLGGMRPRRFWGNLYPTQPSRPRRLLAYWLILSLLILLPFGIYGGSLIAQEIAFNRKTRSVARPILTAQEQATVVQMYGSVQKWMDESYPVRPNFRMLCDLFRYRNRPLVFVPLFAFAWPWLTLAAMMIFQISMRRGQVRPVHVLRCVIYAADAIALAGLMVPAWFLCFERPRRGWVIRYVGAYEFVRYALLAVALVLTYRLCIAFRTYLRFDHALATAAASQIIVGLLIWKFGLDWHMLSW